MHRNDTKTESRDKNFFGMTEAKCQASKRNDESKAIKTTQKRVPTTQP